MEMVRFLIARCSHVAIWVRFLLNFNICEYISGQSISMLDVLLFPHLQRSSMLGKLAPELVLDKDRFQLFTAWLDAMMTVPAVRQTAFSEAAFLNVIERLKMRNANK